MFAVLRRIFRLAQISLVQNSHLPDAVKGDVDGPVPAAFIDLLGDAKRTSRVWIKKRAEFVLDFIKDGNESLGTGRRLDHKNIRGPARISQKSGGNLSRVKDGPIDIVVERFPGIKWKRILWSRLGWNARSRQSEKYSENDNACTSDFHISVRRRIVWKSNLPMLLA